jgi:hypothetical protein
MLKFEWGVERRASVVLIRNVRRGSARELVEALLLGVTAQAVVKIGRRLC